MSNPPFKADFSDTRDDLADDKYRKRFWAGVPNITNDPDKMEIYLMFLQHIVASMDFKGHAAMVVPTGFLTAKGKTPMKVRKKMVESKMLRGVVSTPSNIFANTGTNVSIVFLDASVEHDHASSWTPRSSARSARWMERTSEPSFLLMTELEETARLIYDYWFTQFDFPDENGRPYRSSGGKMVWSDELKREIPEGWGIGTLEDYLHLEKDTITPVASQAYEHYSIPAYDDGKYPTFDDGGSIESGKYRVSRGYILYSKLNKKFKRLWRP